MQKNIHPQYGPSDVQCACGNTFQTRSTKKLLKIEICNQCHPFFTGKHKFIDKAGRIERFMRKYNKTNQTAEKAETTVSQDTELTKKSA